MRVKAIVIGRWLYELSVTAGKSGVVGDAPREFFDGLTENDLTGAHEIRFVGDRQRHRHVLLDEQHRQAILAG